MALAIARKLGNTNPTIGHAVGESLSMWLSRGGYPDIKKNPDQFVNLLAKTLQARGMYVDENVKKTIRDALEKSMKIADKLIPDVSSVKHLDAISRAIANDAEDPFQILRNAGIEIEPELEEFRQFLAEISGKKIEEKKKAPAGETLELPSDALLDVLSILQALEFADYSEKAREKALQKLSSAVRELSRKDPTPESLLKLGLYAYALELVKEERWENIGKLRKF
ncbi:hypothetical protein [Thermococcus siculi]|nr:hypothetical protein [Thermococcus siculi]